MNYHYEYRFIPGELMGLTTRHSWLVFCVYGTLELHIEDFRTLISEAKGIDLPEYGAGLEVHSKIPPGHSPNAKPSWEHCHILNGPCWHSGTTLYAEEKYLPIFKQWKDIGGLPKYHYQTMFELLKDEAERIFGGREEKVENENCGNLF